MDFHCHCIASKRKWRKSKVKVIPRKRNIVDGTTASNLSCIPPSPPAHHRSDFFPGVTQFSNTRFVWKHLLRFVLLFRNSFFFEGKSGSLRPEIHKWIFIVGVKNKEHWMCLQSMDVRLCCVLLVCTYPISIQCVKGIFSQGNTMHCLFMISFSSFLLLTSTRKQVLSMLLP